MPLIPTIWRQRQVQPIPQSEFQVSQGFTEKLCLKYIFFLHEFSLISQTLLQYPNLISLSSPSMHINTHVSSDLLTEAYYWCALLMLCSSILQIVFSHGSYQFFSSLHLHYGSVIHLRYSYIQFYIFNSILSFPIILVDFEQF